MTSAPINPDGTHVASAILDIEDRIGAACFRFVLDLDSISKAEFFQSVDLNLRMLLSLAQKYAAEAGAAADRKAPALKVLK